MSASTNSLIAKAKRFALPLGLISALAVAVPFVVCHERVHAAAATFGGTPLDDNSVSSLVALDNAMEAIASRVTPSVVNVSVTAKVTPDQDEDGEQGSGGIPPNALTPGLQQFFGFGNGGPQMKPQPQIEHGIGSGVIVSPDGYIVTNNHVVQGATQVRVTLNDRRVLNAKVIGTDKLTDLAVIKVNEHNLPAIAWGNSSNLHPGQTVLAFGSPFGYFQFSVTRGIISALNRPNPYTDDPRKPGDFIQTDAAINPGNSGGPLVDSRGELIGINTFIITGSGSFAGAGFAIPSQMVRSVADEIIKNGVVHHGYLGISMNDVTPENSSFFNLPDATGAIVSSVTPDSPAGLAGLKSGDVLRGLNGKKIVNGGQLQVAVSQVSPGTTISLEILRDGKPQTVSVKVGEFHGEKQVAENGGPNGGGSNSGKLGLAVEDLNSDIRQQLNLPASVNGAIVENVRPGSPAEDAGLGQGDVILEVNRHAVKDASSFANEVHAAPAGKDILLLVWSRGGTSYRVVHAAQSSDNGM